MYYPHVTPYTYRSYTDQDDSRVFPVLPFLTGLAFGPFLYGAFHQGGYYPYPPPPPPYYPYGYGYNPYSNPYYNQGF